MSCSCGKKEIYFRGLCRKCYDREHHIAHKVSRNAQSRAYGKTDAGKQARRRNARKLRTRYNVTRSSAKKRGIAFSLDQVYYELLITEHPCYYCGGSLPETGSGLDRVDNTQGYVFGNVVPCCKSCNKFKGDLLSADEARMLISMLKDTRGGTVWNR